MRGVSQISPPIRIVLAVAALFLVAWMTVLKPKSADVPPAPAPITTGNVATGKPAVSAPGKLAEKAKAAAESASKHAAANAGESTGSATTTTPATGSATKSATGSAPAATPAAASSDLTGLPAPVVKAIRKQQVMVIGFFTAKSADDRAVRSAMLKADRWNGRVWVKAAPIGRIAAWGRIARGVDVEQSPTVVVVGRDLNATALVGYVDAQTIDQAVVDSLRSAGGLFTSAYLRKVNHTCAGAADALFASPDARTMAQTPKTFARDTAILTGFAGDLRAIKAPARYKAFKAGTVADVVAIRNIYGSLAKTAARHPSRAALVSAALTAVERIAPVNKRFDKRMKANHVITCVHG
jgi:hypothetical protein